MNEGPKSNPMNGETFGQSEQIRELCGGMHGGGIPRHAVVDNTHI